MSWASAFLKSESLPFLSLQRNVLMTHRCLSLRLRRIITLIPGCDREADIWFIMSHRLHPHPPSIQYDQVFVLPRSRDHFLMFRIHWISIRTTLVILEAEISSRTRRTKGKAWVTYNASVLIKKFCICATRFERFFIRSFTVALHTDKNITFRSNANYARSKLHDG